MKINIKSRLQKKDILTIPNLLSLFRLLLIPAIVLLYAKEYHYASVSLILLSAITDIVDGWIARHFNMISDFGKFLDPVADKLTQIALLSCLLIRYPWTILLIGLLVIKDLFQLIYGIIVLKKTDMMNSAKWFGKLNTVVLYTSMILLFLMPNIPEAIATVILIVCGVAMLCSMILYGRFFHLFIKQTETKNEEKQHESLQRE